MPCRFPSLVTIARVHFLFWLFELVRPHRFACLLSFCSVLARISAVGIMLCSVRKIRPTMLACSTHKWLRGPSGCCLAYISPEVRIGPKINSDGGALRLCLSFRIGSGCIAFCPFTHPISPISCFLEILGSRRLESLGFSWKEPRFRGRSRLVGCLPKRNGTAWLSRNVLRRCTQVR